MEKIGVEILLSKKNKKQFHIRTWWLSLFFNYQGRVSEVTIFKVKPILVKNKLSVIGTVDSIDSIPINRYTINRYEILNRYTFLVIFDDFPKKSPIGD